MNPIKYQSAFRAPVFNPISDDFHSRFNRIFDDFASTRQVSHSGIDLYETDEGWFLEVAVPGLTAADIDVDVEGRQLTIKAEPKETDAEGRRYWLQSLPRGSFTRTVRVPRGVDTETVSATVQAGLLTVTMPRSPEARARKVEIIEN